ncbi:MAG: hypothetical protein Q7T05_03960 [Dehalococcoidia bacterium]|nr:hypothetical protein [Dehalococcoidia bacterium]
MSNPFDSLTEEELTGNVSPRKQKANPFDSLTEEELTQPSGVLPPTWEQAEQQFRPGYFRKGDLVAGRYPVSSGYRKGDTWHKLRGVFDIGGKALRLLGETPQQAAARLQALGYVTNTHLTEGENSSGEHVHGGTPGITPAGPLADMKKRQGMVDATRPFTKKKVKQAQGAWVVGEPNRAALAAVQGRARTALAVGKARALAVVPGAAGVQAIGKAVEPAGRELHPVAEPGSQLGPRIRRATAAEMIKPIITPNIHKTFLTGVKAVLGVIAPRTPDEQHAVELARGAITLAAWVYPPAGMALTFGTPVVKDWQERLRTGKYLPPGQTQIVQTFKAMGIDPVYAVTHLREIYKRQGAEGLVQAALTIATTAVMGKQAVKGVKGFVKGKPLPSGVNVGARQAEAFRGPEEAPLIPAVEPAAPAPPPPAAAPVVAPTLRSAPAARKGPTVSGPRAGLRRGVRPGEVAEPPAAAPVVAEPVARGAVFVPSTEWQEIPKGTPVPPGGEFRMDMASGKNYGRWDTPPPPKPPAAAAPVIAEAPPMAEKAPIARGPTGTELSAAERAFLSEILPQVERFAVRKRKSKADYLGLEKRVNEIADKHGIDRRAAQAAALTPIMSRLSETMGGTVSATDRWNLAASRLRGESVTPAAAAPVVAEGPGVGEPVAEGSTGEARTRQLQAVRGLAEAKTAGDQYVAVAKRMDELDILIEDASRRSQTGKSKIDELTPLLKQYENLETLKEHLNAYLMGEDIPSAGALLTTKVNMRRDIDAAFGKSTGILGGARALNRRTGKPIGRFLETYDYEDVGNTLRQFASEPWGFGEPPTEGKALSVWIGELLHGRRETVFVTGNTKRLWGEATDAWTSTEVNELKSMLRERYQSLRYEGQPSPSPSIDLTDVELPYPEFTHRESLTPNPQIEVVPTVTSIPKPKAMPKVVPPEEKLASLKARLARDETYLADKTKAAKAATDRGENRRRQDTARRAQSTRNQIAKLEEPEVEGPVPEARVTPPMAEAPTPKLIQAADALKAKREARMEEMRKRGAFDQDPKMGASLKDMQDATIITAEWIAEQVARAGQKGVDAATLSAAWLKEVASDWGEGIKGGRGMIWDAAQTEYNKVVRQEYGLGPIEPKPLSRGGAKAAEGVKRTTELTPGTAGQVEIRKSATTTAREARGLPGVKLQEYPTLAKAEPQARQALESGAVDPDALARSFVDNPRVETPAEAVITGLHRTALENQYEAAARRANAAIDAGDTSGAAAAKAQMADLESRLQVNEQASGMFGREASAALNAMKAAIDKQRFTLTNLLRDFKAKQGHDLTDAEIKQVTAEHQKLVDLQAEFDAYKAKLGTAQTRRLAGPRVTDPRAAGFGERNTIFTRDRLEAARARLQEKGKRLTTGVDPTVVADLVEIGGYYVEGGVRAFGKWYVEMKREAPGATKAELDAAFQKLMNDKRLSALKTRGAKRLGELEEATATIEAGGQPPQRVKLPEVILDAEGIRLLQTIEGQRAKLVELVRAGKPLGLRGWTVRVINEVAGSIKAIKSSYDESFGGRQGRHLAVGEFRQWLGMWKVGTKVFWSRDPKIADRIITEEMHASPEFVDAQHARLAITRKARYPGDPLAEEAYTQTLGSKFPLVERSDLAFTSMSNYLRFKTFEGYVHRWKADGTYTPERGEALAGFLNAATGRGSLGRFERAAPTLNLLFFSPKKIAGDVQWWSYLTNKDPAIRKIAAKNIVGYVGAVTGALALAKASGAQVETDPRSSDFGKIRIGKTRFDVTGGDVTMIRYVAQLISSSRKNLQTGKIQKVRPEDLMLQFGKSKASPAVGLAFNLRTGKDYTGEDVYKAYREQPIRRAVNDFAPMITSDILEAYYEQGWKMAVPVGAAAFVGIGAQTHQTKQPARTRSRFVPGISGIKGIRGIRRTQ